MIDVTEIVVPTTRVPTGVDPKEWVTYEGSTYLMKWGKLTPYSEYVSSQFMQRLGMNVQHVELVIYKGLICAMCSDIGEIKHFMDISESSLDTEQQGKSYCMDDVLHEIDCMKKLSPTQRNKLKFNFKYLFILDAILGNRDRHPGNWGYLTSGEPASIYDSGASLFPHIQSYEETNVKRLFRRLTLEEPKSSVRVDSVKKHNYLYTLTHSTIFDEEIAYLEKHDVIKAIKDSVESLPDNLKWFYERVLTLRYCCIIRKEDFDVVYGRLDKESPTITTSVLDMLRGLSHM